MRHSQPDHTPDGPHPGPRRACRFWTHETGHPRVTAVPEAVTISMLLMTS